MRKNRRILTKEEIMTFTDAQLEQAKAELEAEIAEIKSARLVTTYVINNDVGSRRTPEQLRDAELKPHVENLRLINEAIKNRNSIMEFLNTPDPELDDPSQGPNQE